VARVEGLALEASVPVKLDLHLTVDGSNFDDVGDFHRRFDLPAVPSGGGAAEPGHADYFDEGLYRFRVRFLREELKEFTDGWDSRDLAQMADALVDLVYVALGTAQLLGLPWQELWDEVQRANMTKVRASSAAQSRASTGRGHASDVVKPEGFVPPDVAGVLQRRGFALTWDVE
jgi:predicted HAD superfamily Cof-like phosphohydrolase